MVRIVGNVHRPVEIYLKTGTIRLLYDESVEMDINEIDETAKSQINNLAKNRVIVVTGL